MTDNPPNTIKAWLERLKKDDMPVFGKTVQDIMNVAQNQDSSFSELAKVILEDASMTAKVLKLANAVLYNPSNQSISTISRAIILLGFEKVRNLSLTVALVDSQVRGVNREHLMQELARSLHAATQAREFAKGMKIKNSEEIFVSALLHNIGELAFWCMAQEEGRKVDEAMRRGMNKSEAEVEVLGFQLKQLSIHMAKDWNLGKMLQESLTGKGNGKNCKLIALSNGLASASEKGWQSPEVALIQKRLTSLTGFEGVEVVEATQRNAKLAVQTCKHFGATATNIVLPPRQGSGGGHIVTSEKKPAQEVSRYNPSLQLEILRDISNLLLGKPDFNVLLEMCLEGIYRGVGMDRAIFGLVGSGHKEIRAKYIVGGEREKILAGFCLPLQKKPANIFQKVLTSKKGVWVGKPNKPAISIDSGISRFLGGSSFFIMPVTVAGKSFGLFYADRLPSGRQLDQQSYDNFEFFALQASLGLERITQMKKR